MNKIALIVVCLALSGCTVATVSDPLSSTGENPVRAKKVFASSKAIDRLLTGISRQQANAQIGNQVTTGYDIAEAAKLITVNNPYRTETFNKQNTVFIVDYYFTSTNRADGKITDDELTPLVFENDRLIGKGWAFLNKMIREQHWK